MLEVGILIFGITLLILGKISLNKFERNRTDKENNSGVFFQLNTFLLYSGSVLVIVSLIFLLGKN